MSFLDRLFGGPTTHTASGRRVALSPDERAIESYRYLVRTAPPAVLEQVHAEAFAKLSDEQRAVIYTELCEGAGTGERPLSSEPATLSRAAIRAEGRTPGTLEHSFLGGSLFATVARLVVGSALVSAFLPWDAEFETDAVADAEAAAFGDFEF